MSTLFSYKSINSEITDLCPSMSSLFKHSLAFAKSIELIKLTTSLDLTFDEKSSSMIFWIFFSIAFTDLYKANVNPLNDKKHDI